MQRISALWSSGARGKVMILVAGLLGLCIICSVFSTLTSRSTPAQTAATGTQPQTASAASQPTIAPAVKATDTVRPTEPPRPTNTPAPTNTPRPTNTPLPTATPVPTVAPQEFSGQGQQAIPKFHLNAGLVVFRATHGGRRNFSVELRDDQGQLVELPANVIGPYDGSRAFDVGRTGDYLMNVQGDGLWTITLEQPSPPADAPAPPQALMGNGPTASSWTNLKAGATTIKYSHKGTRNFAITLLNAQGQPVDLVVNTIGPTEGSKIVRIPRAGGYIFDIMADGDWDMTIE